LPIKTCKKLVRKIEFGLSEGGVVKTWGIKAKMGFLTGSLLLLVAGIGGAGIYATIALSQNLNDVISDTIPVIRNITLVDMVHDGVHGSVAEAMYAFEKKEVEALDSALEAINEHEKNVKESFAIIGSKKLDEDMKKLYDTAVTDMEKYLSSAKLTVNLAKEGKVEELEKQYGLFQGQFTYLEGSLEKFGEEFNKSQEDYFMMLVKGFSKMKYSLWFGLFFAFVVGGALAAYFSTSLVKVLNSITGVVASGAVDLEKAMNQLSLSSASLSSSSQQQAAALEETAASAEEISAMVVKSSESAQASEEATKQSRLKAQRGQEVITDMVKAINDINSNNEKIMFEINRSNTRFSEIVNVIQEIGNKTKVINDIVFQTKLLSFNASVEAARAAEHGKGFAVVAEEVGNLASMSGTAAKDITSLLSESMKRVEAIVQETSDTIGPLMQSAKSSVDQGSRVATECSEVLEEIVTESSKVSEMVTSISAASKEQSAGVSEITKAIQHLNQSTQVNAKAAKECAHTSDLLIEQAQVLKSASVDLRQIISGGNSGQAQEMQHQTEESGDNDEDISHNAA
jgi:methyl-accepting chemotaxis protein